MARFAILGKFLATVVTLLALGPRPAAAATLYMGPNETHKTLRQALSAMRGGDTLIIRDGVYKGNDNTIRWGTGGNDTALPPSGSAGAYTIIRAEHEGAVTFDGEDRGYPFLILATSSSIHHIEFHGLKWINAPDSYAAVQIAYNVADISYIKWFRCGAFVRGGTVGPRSAWSISSGHHLLLEECYAWGGGRYGFKIQDISSATGTGAKQVILRRCVVRQDDATGGSAPREAGGQEVIGGFMSYSSESVEFQNCIHIDSDTSYWTHYSYVAGAFTPRRHASGYGYSRDNVIRGSIVLNHLGWSEGRSPAIAAINEDAARPNRMEQCVLWDVMQGVYFPHGGGDADQTGAPWMTNLTVKIGTDPNWRGPYGPSTPGWPAELPVGGYGITNYNAPIWTLKNSAIINHQNDAMAGVYSDYNAVFSNNVDWNVSTVGAGTHDYADDNGNEVNLLTGTPGNGTPALKYIVRVEPGSNLYGTGAQGGHRGATVLKRYGVSGTVWGDPGYNTLTDENLWPFPYEAQIRADMRTYSPAGGPDGRRGFCADGQTLTNYIWGYLGHAVPPLGVVATPASGSVTLNWARPADLALATISGFNIYRVDDEQRSLVAMVDGNATFTATVAALDPADTYAFAMTSVDSRKGESGLSEVITITPSGSPTDGGSSPPTATKTTPAISWATPSPIVQGTALSGAQLNATTAVPGTFRYTPAAGTVLPAGTQTLSATFTPADTSLYTTATAWMSLLVNPAATPRTTPAITWPAPMPITQGTALSGTQLRAGANVPGAFAYTPRAGTVLPAGTHTLSLVFTPADTTRYTTATASTIIVVNAAAPAPSTGNTPATPASTPAITWPMPTPIAAGTALCADQLRAGSSVPGTFVYTPAAGTVLPAGIHTLSLTFTPANTASYRVTTASTILLVSAKTTAATTDIFSAKDPGMPVITWAVPAPITVGTALSGLQLRAGASEPGTFIYTPAAGTILPEGVHTLSLTFTPNRTSKFTAMTASTTLVVRAAAPTGSATTSTTGSTGPATNSPTRTTAVVTWPAPVPIVEGTALGTRQLRAGASVPGTFAYAPDAGTVLPAGTHTLSVVFTPSDTARYAGTTAWTTLTVNPPAFQLSVSRPTGGTIRTAGIVCGTGGTDCRVNMPGAIWLGLQATPDAGYTFARWTGDCSGTASNYALALSGALTCGGVFTRTTLSGQ